MVRHLVHYGIHFLVPLLVALIFYRERPMRAALILIAAILIDLDHLLATPIFDGNRCSIGFHPLHGYWAMGLYLFLLFFKKTRIFGIGLCIHIIADITDCGFLWVQAQ